jgi:hypothetical protein
VYDTSGYGTPLNLIVQDMSKAAWIFGVGLQLTGANKVVSQSAATKLHSALTASDEMTLIVRFTPANVTQTGPARIVSYSADASNRNFTFAQDQQKHLMRLRTSSGSANGTPNVESANVLQADTPQYAIVTYDGSTVRLYRNGVLDGSAERTGSFAEWDSDYWFMLGNEETYGHSWLGTLHQVAIYDKALSPTQVTDLFNVDAGSAGSLLVRWTEFD